MKKKRGRKNLLFSATSSASISSHPLPPPLLSIRIRISLRKLFFPAFEMIYSAEEELNGFSWKFSFKHFKNPGCDPTFTSFLPPFFPPHLSLRCLYLQLSSYFLLARPACVCASLCVAWSCSFSDATPFRRCLSCDNSEDDAQRQRRRRSCVLMHGLSPWQQTGRWDGEELLFTYCWYYYGLKTDKTPLQKHVLHLRHLHITVCVCVGIVPQEQFFGNITRKFIFNFNQLYCHGTIGFEEKIFLMFTVKVSQYEVGQQKKQVKRFGLLLQISKKKVFFLLFQFTCWVMASLKN